MSLLSGIRSSAYKTAVSPIANPSVTIKKPLISYASGNKSKLMMDSIIPAAKFNRQDTDLSPGFRINIDSKPPAHVPIPPIINPAIKKYKIFNLAS